MIATVYRCRDAEGRLLYVGCTTRIGARIGEHAAAREWWGDVTTITLKHYEDFRDAHVAEAMAIRFEDPVHNVHPKEHARRSAATRRAGAA